jgi:hypothetical protein
MTEHAILYLDGVELTKRICVRIEKAPEYYVAYFDDADLFNYGDDPAEAIENLRAHIVEMYMLYTEEERNLSTLPRRELATLRTYIKEKL